VSIVEYIAKYRLNSRGSLRLPALRQEASRVPGMEAWHSQEEQRSQLERYPEVSYEKCACTRSTYFTAMIPLGIPRGTALSLVVVERCRWPKLARVEIRRERLKMPRLSHEAHEGATFINNKAHSTFMEIRQR
jgi:hypothetical protein